MRKAARKVLKTFHLDTFAGNIFKRVRSLKFKARLMFGITDPQIKEYLKQNDIRKLHIGCGDNILSGWLNSDYAQHFPGILHLDATKPFPLGNNEFDYIFSEHLIEHISYSQGLHMLTECFRILREKGTIRISTPDLYFLIDLYKDKKSTLQKEYIRWATDNFVHYAHGYNETFIINHFMREFGHLFIYDEKTLRLSLEKSGFTNITKCAINQSEDDSLRNLENDKRIPVEFLRLETITLEGRKLVES